MTLFNRLSLQRLRQHLGWSQRELAKQLNVPQMTVYRWEKGVSRPNSASYKGLRSLAKENAIDPGFFETLASGPNVSYSSTLGYPGPVRDSVQSNVFDAHQMLQLIHDYTSLVTSSDSQSELVQAAAKSMLEKTHSQIRLLSEMNPRVTSRFIPLAQESLMHGVSDSFHAVSERDILFWTDPAHRDVRRPYLEACYWAAQKGKSISRMFIVNANKDLHTMERVHSLATLLWSHQRFGIEWALVFEEDLKERASQSMPRDFALFDWTEAISYFKNRKSQDRSLEVTFASPKKGEHRSRMKQFERQLYILRDLLSTHRETSDGYLTLIGTSSEFWSKELVHRHKAQRDGLEQSVAQRCRTLLGEISALARRGVTTAAEKQRPAMQTVTDIEEVLFALLGRDKPSRRNNSRPSTEATSLSSHHALHTQDVSAPS